MGHMHTSYRQFADERLDALQEAVSLVFEALVVLVILQIETRSAGFFTAFVGMRICRQKQSGSLT